MVKFCVLGSGSSGNAALIATGTTRILVDAGLSYRELGKRLAAIGEHPIHLDAVLVTHEHSDHIAGLPQLTKRTGIPIYLSHLTSPAIQWEDQEPKIETFQAGASFELGDIKIQSFTIPHDAADPVGFCFEAGGVRIGLVTDLGYIPESIKYHLLHAELLMLEANHDIEMLKVGPYPWSVKQRVMSRNGHLSNDVVGDFLLEDLNGLTRTLILGHLSEHNNHPEIVRLVGQQALDRRGLPTRLVIASQQQPSEVFQF